MRRLLNWLKSTPFRFSFDFMKWFFDRLTLSWGITLLLVTGASAQAVVQGVVQPDEALAAERRAAERTNQPWSVNLGASEFSETNTQPGAPANAAVLGSELDAALARTWTFRARLSRSTATPANFSMISTQTA